MVLVMVMVMVMVLVLVLVAADCGVGDEAEISFTVRKKIEYKSAVEYA